MVAIQNDIAAEMGSKLKAARVSKLTPQAKRLLGVGLAIVGGMALMAVGSLPERFAAAMPSLDELENWLVWRESRSF